MRVFTAIAAAIALSWVCHPIDATAGSAILHWHATGDDSLYGQATAYDLRYSTSPITTANFGSAIGVGGLPPPSPSGTPESFMVAGLQSGILYYFAIKARDDAGHWSGMSNLASKTATATVDVGPRLAVLSFSPPRPNPARAGSMFALELPTADKVLVEAFDIMGRRVRVIENRDFEAGSYSLRWDLYDDHGVRLAPGLYRIRARIGSTTFSRSIAILG